MKYLGIAEAVTGIDAVTLTRVSRGDLLDSALHAPQAGYGNVDIYPSLIEKAAVLCVRITQNHPLPDGNKRLAWISMVLFLEINDVLLDVEEDDAVHTMNAVAAKQVNETQLASWLSVRLRNFRPDKP